MIGVIMMEYRRNNAGMRANRQTDMLGFGEVGGVGQLVYHSFRFADYEIDYSNFAHQKHSLKLEKYGFVTKKTHSLCIFSQFL